MMRAYEHLPAGLWDRRRQVDAVLLDYEERHRRRIRLPTLSGAELLLDLPATVRLRDGDGLRLEDGGVVRVRARPERLLAVMAADPHALLRLAWHLGNRHLAVQILPDRLHIREDAVIAAMVRGLGGTAETVMAPFDPEGGAYAAGHPPGPPHGHDGRDADAPGHAARGPAQAAPGGEVPANDHHPGHDHAPGDDHAHTPGHDHAGAPGHDHAGVPGHDHAGVPGHDHHHGAGHDHPHAPAHDHAPGPGRGDGHAHDG